MSNYEHRQSITVWRKDLQACKGRRFPALVLGYLRDRADVLTEDGEVVSINTKISNQEIADYFSVTPRYVTSAITFLRMENQITGYEYNGRERTITLNHI